LQLPIWWTLLFRVDLLRALRVLSVERGDGGRVVLVDCLAILLSQCTNLLVYLWIDRAFLLGKGRHNKADCQSYDFVTLLRFPQRELLLPFTQRPAGPDPQEILFMEHRNYIVDSGGEKPISGLRFNCNRHLGRPIARDLL
jgi:hypothetical protein